MAKVHFKKDIDIKFPESAFIYAKKLESEENKNNAETVNRLKERIEICKKNPQDKRYVEFILAELEKILDETKKC